MVDAAGAIYVIGGFGGYTTRFQDVWASTDGGALTGLGHGGGVGGYSEWVLEGTKG